MKLYLLMKKLSAEIRGQKKDMKFRFNLSTGNLACFKSLKLGKEKDEQKSLNLEGKGKDLSPIANFKALVKTEDLQPIRQSKTVNRMSFNERVVIMEYDNLDVYVDQSTRKKVSTKGSKSSKGRQTRSLSESSSNNSFISSCVRVVTEETDNTSNPISYQISPQTLTQREGEMYFPPFSYSEFSCKTERNWKSRSGEQSKFFQIDYHKIESDGRTTVMVKNIPNKYTQDMLLEDFTIHHQNKFDFFYLPIDKDNNCNVGYAFLNFINPIYLKNFFEEFHMKKWKRYKSPKICNITYAKYQGTLELANHFQHTKIIYKKDRRVRPLMGLNEASRIQEIVKIQQMGKQ